MKVLVVSNESYNDAAYVRTILTKYNAVEQIDEVVAGDSTFTATYSEDWATVMSRTFTDASGLSHADMLDTHAPDLVLEFDALDGDRINSVAMSVEARSRGIKTATVATG